MHQPYTTARVFFDYDGGGKPLYVQYSWDMIIPNPGPPGTLNITTTNIEEFQYTYDPLSNFKTSATTYLGSGTTWTLGHTENYGYDSNFDYLTSANYGDGLANANPVWTYDAAGNRASDSTNPGAWEL